MFWFNSTLKRCVILFLFSSFGGCLAVNFLYADFSVKRIIKRCKSELNLNNYLIDDFDEEQENESVTFYSKFFGCKFKDCSLVKNFKPDVLFVACRGGENFSAVSGGETLHQTIVELSKVVAARIAKKQKNINALNVRCYTLSSSDNCGLCDGLKTVITRDCNSNKKVHLAVCLIGACAKDLCHAMKKEGFINQKLLSEMGDSLLIFIDPTVPSEDDVCDLLKRFVQIRRAYNFYTKARSGFYRKIKGYMKMVAFPGNEKKSALAKVVNINVLDRMTNNIENGEDVDLRKASKQLFQGFGLIMDDINYNYCTNNDFCAKVCMSLDWQKSFVFINRPTVIDSIKDNCITLRNNKEGWVWAVSSKKSCEWNVADDLNKEQKYNDEVVLEEKKLLNK